MLSICMARRKRSYASRRPRRRSSSGGGTKQILDGVLAGTAMSLARKFLPNTPFVDDAAVLGVGYFRKNQTLKIIGGMGLGQDLAGIIPLGKGMTTTGGYI